MKNFLILSVLIAFATLNSGCGTIYGAAVDERNVKTIAQDTAIKTKILKQLIEDKTVKALDISASSYNGQAYLIGEYSNEIQKEKAIKIAKSVDGVKGVTHYLIKKQTNSSCGTKENLTLVRRLII